MRGQHTPDRRSPSAGKICFDSDVTECVSGPAGEARWVSPNLFYKEHFEQIAEPNPPAQKLVELGFAGNEDGDETCEYPVTFAVTNFDPDDVEGQPNFEDAPDDRVSQSTPTPGTQT